MELKELIRRLNTLEKTARTHRIILFALFSILIIVCLLQPLEMVREKFYLASYLLALLSIVVKLGPSLKGRYNLITNEADLNKQNYIEKLKKRLTFNTRYLILFLLLGILAINSALLGLYEQRSLFNFDFNAQNRIFMHLATVLIFVVGYATHKKRMQKVHREIYDLINALENLDLKN